MSTSLRRHAVAALLAALPIASASAQVEVSEIPPIAPGWTCSAHAINEPGDVLMNCRQVEGVPITFFREQPSVWSTRDRTHTLVIPVAGNPRTFAAGLNNLGQVVGHTCPESLNCQPVSYLWSKDAPARIFSDFYFMLALNDVGELLGFNRNHPGTSLRRADGTVVPLPPFVQPNWNSLNNLSRVAVHSADGFFVWSPDGGLIALPDSGIMPRRDPSSAQSTSLSDAGLFSGEIDRQAFLYNPATGYARLSEELFDVYPMQINAAGNVAGMGSTNGTDYTGMFWRTPAEAIILPAHEGLSTYAVASNSSGLVVGGNWDDSKVLLWKVPPAGPTTPSEYVAVVQTSITDLVTTGSLSSNDAKGLASKLEAASKSLEEADTVAANNLLRALSNQVKALEKSGRLSASAAAALQAQIADAMSNI
jgi:hypothetical protein